MKITVSSKNEFFFYPEIADNSTLPSGKKFTIVLRKINKTLNATKWVNYSKDGEVSYDAIKQIGDHIVRLENAPKLEIDGGESERLMTVDDLLGSEFPELFIITEQIMVEIKKIQEQGNFETKKS